MQKFQADIFSSFWDRCI